MKQAILWLSKPLKINSGEIDVVAANVINTEGAVDNMATISHSAGEIRVQYSHILEKDDVTNDLWLVGNLPSFHDMRGQ